jgi:hypothetical protein
MNSNYENRMLRAAALGVLLIAAAAIALALLPSVTVGGNIVPPIPNDPCGCYQCFLECSQPWLTTDAYTPSWCDSMYSECMRECKGFDASQASRNSCLAGSETFAQKDDDSDPPDTGPVDPNDPIEVDPPVEPNDPIEKDIDPFSTPTPTPCSAEYREELGFYCECCGQYNDLSLLGHPNLPGPYGPDRPEQEVRHDGKLKTVADRLYICEFCGCVNEISWGKLDLWRSGVAEVSTVDYADNTDHCEKAHDIFRDVADRLSGKGDKIGAGEATDRLIDGFKELGRCIEDNIG